MSKEDEIVEPPKKIVMVQPYIFLHCSCGQLMDNEAVTKFNDGLMIIAACLNEGCIHYEVKLSGFVPLKSINKYTIPMKEI